MKKTFLTLASLAAIAFATAAGLCPAHAASWTNYPHGTPHDNDTFLFGDLTDNTNKQATYAALFAQNTNEVWVTPYGTNGAGNGRVTSPFVVTNAATFDALFNVTNGWPNPTWPCPTNIPTNTTIHLMAGTFHTYMGVTMQTGWKIRGAGIDNTIIRQEPFADTNLLSWDGAVIGGAGFGSPAPYYPNGRQNMEVSDLTIDCNEQNKSYTNFLRSRAVCLTGDNALINRVKVINWAATWGEAFLIGIENCAAPFCSGGTNKAITRNVVIENCIIGNPAAVKMTTGVSAIYIGGMTTNVSPGAGWIEGAEVRNCSVSSVTAENPPSVVGRPTWFNFLVPFSSTTGLKFRNNFAFDLTVSTNGLSNAIYNDTFYNSLQDFVIEDNVFINVWAGIYFNPPTPPVGSTFNNWVIRNNVIRYSTNTLARGISMGLNSGSFNNLVIAGNYIAPYTTAPTSENAIAISYATNLVVVDNIIDAGGQGNEFYIFTNGVSVANCYNNWTTKGAVPSYDSSAGMLPMPEVFHSGSVTATNFNGNGAGLTNLNATNLTGTVPNASIPNTLWTNQNQTWYLLTNSNLGTYIAWIPGIGLVKSNTVNHAATLIVGTNGGAHYGSWTSAGAGNVIEDGTNTAGYFIGNGGGITNLTAMNMVHVMNTFASASNALTLNNSYWLLQISGNGAITNVIGQITGQLMWSTLWVSNSSGSAITFYYTAAGRAIGAATTNQLSIAAGKMGGVSVFGYGSLFTNYCNAVQQ